MTARPTEAVLNLPQHMPSGLGRALWAPEDSGGHAPRPHLPVTRGSLTPPPPGPASPSRAGGKATPFFYRRLPNPSFYSTEFTFSFGPATVSEHFTIGARPGSTGSRPTLRVRKWGRVQPGPQSPRFKPFLLPPPPSKRRPAHQPSRAAPRASHLL